MNYKKRIKSECIKKIDETCPKVEGIENKTPSHKKWKIVVPVASSVLAAGVVVTLVMTLTPKNGTANNFNKAEALALQSPRESLDFGTSSVSESSKDIYLSFYQNFTPLIFTEGTSSTRSFSVFDAFSNVATLVYFSSDEVSKDLLPLFGSPSLEELKTAVKELTLTIGTTSIKTSGAFQGLATGGYSANSVWFDPNVINEEGISKDYLETYTNDFYGSLISTRPTTDKVEGWLKDAVPSSYPIPKVAIDDGTDAASVSSYFLRVPLESGNLAKEQYNKGNHKFTYTNNGKSQETDYIDYQRKMGLYFTSDTLVGGQNYEANLAVYLPNDESAAPASILSDVVTDNYETKWVSKRYDVSIPYFTIENKKLLLNDPLKKSGGTKIFESGAMQKLLGNNLFLTSIFQSSKVNFDYDGFQSSSVTVSEMAGGAAGNESGVFELEVNRPFLFVQSLSAPIEGEKYNYCTLPTTIGEITDLSYSR